MIKSLHTKENRIPEPVLLKDIDFGAPFYEGLQYNAPARGVWNIVHTGMLIPEAHQVYVCAQGCLRGVILTAAEMNATTRMSWVALREEDMCFLMKTKELTLVKYIKLTFNIFN